MHIAFLTPEYPHERLGHAAGIGTSIRNLALGMIKKGVEVTVFVYSQKKDFVINDLGITIHSLKKQTYKIGGWYLYRKYLERYVNKNILLHKIDFLEAPDWTGITAFMKFKCPLIIKLHGSDSYFCKLEGRKLKLKNFWFEKLALKSADYLISVSAFTAQETQHIFNLSQKITVIPNGVDTNLFIPNSQSKISKSVLYFGSIIRKKGVLELPSIFKKVHQELPFVKFVMAGQDVVDAKTGKSTVHLFKKQCDQKLLKQVNWLGNLSYNEVQDELKKASVVVLPSYAEALPMTWLEAMAMQKAMVTSNIGWAPEVMVHEKTGFTFAPDDHQNFASHIIALLKDPDLSLRLGRAARERVEMKFSIDVVVAQHIKFYKLMQWK